MVEWADPAKFDLFEIVEYISLDDLESAKKVSVSIKEKVVSLQLYPERGRVVPELAKLGIYSFRELIITPWRIIYKVENRCVYIELIADGQRDLQDLLFRRIMR